MKHNYFKSIYSIIIIIGGVIIGVSCNSHNEITKANAFDISLSECIADKANAFDTTLTIHYQNGNLQISHNLVLNCAISDINIESYYTDNEIIINYLVNDNFSANCLCPKFLKYELGGIPSGTYTIIIKIDDTILLQQEYILS